MSENTNTPEISLPSFSNYNKLHWMLGGEAYALSQGKEMFVRDLKQAQKAEKAYCERHKVEPRMTGNLFNEICGMVDSCKSFYEVEALARYVFDDSYVPTREEIETRAKALKDIVPVWDWLRANPNAKRSY